MLTGKLWFPAASWRLARNNLTGRPWRTGLIIGAVVLAASLAVAVSSAISSVQASMELALERVLGKADARIIHPGLGRFDSSLLDEVRAWPEVEHASGRVNATLTLVHSDRRSDENGRLLRTSPSAIGVNYADDSHFLEVTLVDGQQPNPNHPNEILLDSLTAEELQAKVGDQLAVDRWGAPIHLTIAGIYERQKLIGAVQRPQMRIDVDTLAKAVHIGGELSTIVIRTRSGVDVPRFCEKYSAALPDQIALEPAEKVRSGFDRRIEASRFAVIVTSILTFMSASFIIVTAMTTSVTERQREMAVVRSIGASRSQLFLSQLLLGVTLGLIGAVIAVPLGIGLAGILTAIFHEELPAGLTVGFGGIALAIIGSVVAGLLGAFYPALVASSVSPMEAMARRARPAGAAGLALCAIVGLLLIAAQLGLMAPSLPGGVDGRFFSYMFAGLPSVHVGYFVLAVPAVLLASTVASPLISRLLRLPPGVLGRSVLSTPYRHGFTAGALMVGISVLVSTWGGATSLLRDWVSRIEFADGFAYHPTGISPQHQLAIAKLPFVKESCPIGYLPLTVIGERVFGVETLSPANVLCIGFDPDVFFAMNAVDWIEGDPNRAIPRLEDGDAVIVAERFLVARGMGVGDHITLGAGRIEKSFEIVGVVGSPGLEIAIQSFGVRSAYMEYAVSCVFMDFRAVAEHFDNHDAYIMQLNLDENVSDEVAEAVIAEVAPGVRFRSGRWILDQIHGFLATLLTAQTIIAFSALLLACLGAGNVIAANIHARRYEYGVLRAAGAHRGMLFRLILAEAGVLALTGAIVGTALGIHLTWAGTVFYKELAGIELRTAFAILPVSIGWGVLILMTLAAATPPAIALMRKEPATLLATGRNG